jgi:hypothetical protein
VSGDSDNPSARRADAAAREKKGLRYRKHAVTPGSNASAHPRHLCSSFQAGNRPSELIDRISAGD